MNPVCLAKMKLRYTFCIRFYQANGYPDYFESVMAQHQIWLWCQNRKFWFEKLDDELFVIEFESEDDFVLFKLTWM